MRHTPTQAVIPPTILSQNFLQSISPSQSVSPSIAQYSAGLAHDARNMLAAMDIYCELLASPGVLKADDKHLLDELRLLRDSSGKLLDRLLVEALKCLGSSDKIAGKKAANHRPDDLAHASRLAMSSPEVANTLRAAMPAAVLYDPAEQYSPSGAQAALPAIDTGRRVTDLAAELQSTLPMLSALAGPRVHISLAVDTCPSGRLVMPPVDLTRVLINLVRNAAEAMSIGGRIVIRASGVIAATGVNRAQVIDDSGTNNGTPAIHHDAVLLSIEDNGPGIPLSLLDRIFDLQVSNATQEESSRPRMQFRPRGLGLRIVREFVEASGGSVRALRLPDRGSRFELVLPMVTEEVTKVGNTM